LRIESHDRFIDRGDAFLDQRDGPGIMRQRRGEFGQALFSGSK
jgi:hypothetical protein